MNFACRELGEISVIGPVSGSMRGKDCVGSGRVGAGVTSSDGKLVDVRGRPTVFVTVVLLDPLPTSDPAPGLHSISTA